MTRYEGLALIVCAVGACAAEAAPQAAHDPSALFASGSSAFSRGQYEEAVSSFKAAAEAGMTGPAVHYNIGVSYYKLGDFERAEAAFRSLAFQFPEMSPLADYNLGLALVRQSRLAEARAAFERAQRGEDRTIARLADAMLARPDLDAPASSIDADTSPGVPPVIRLFDVALGYDDNVALVEESSLPAGESTGSPFLEMFGLVSARPASLSSFRFDASAYLVRYDDAQEFDQESLRLAFSYLWSWSDWRFDAGPYFNYGALDGDGFEQRLGATLNARYPFGDASSLLIRLTHDKVDELASAFDFVEGTRDRVSIGFEQQRSRGKLEVGYVHEQNDRIGASVSPTRQEVFAGYEYSVSTDWSLEVQGTLRSSRYEELTTPRDEDLSQLSFTATRDFDTGWQLLGQYRLADNGSNVDAFSYDRNRLVVGLNKLF